MSSSAYDRSRKNNSSMLDSSQNKQIACSGLLGKEQNEKNIISQWKFMIHTHLKYRVQFWTLYLKKGKTVEEKKFQSRAPRLTEWGQQFLHTITEQDGSLQPRIKEEYVGWDKMDTMGVSDTTSCLEEIGTQINLFPPSPGIRTQGHQRKLAATRYQTIKKSAFSTCV